MSAHDFPRATGDLDVFVSPEPQNAERVWAALARSGAPLHDHEITIEELSRRGLVFWLGNEPERIDVMTAIDGVTFEEAWETRVYIDMDGMSVPVVSLETLLKTKRATGRPKDRHDVAWIEEELNRD